MPDSVLRVLTCGSVDDGKSTLIGRLLFECGSIPDDVLAVLERDSRRFGTVDGGTDYALLVDGLEAEREQGVTIDVAYRFFETPARRFILADTPGHQQYTRNMVTGASTADLAILLIDARKGILPQTRRHAAIASLLGISQVVLAVNKMDLVGFDQSVFTRIEQDFRDILPKLRFHTVTAIPLCARDGDNVTGPGSRMSWFQGGSLLRALETAQTSLGEAGPFRMPVQYVNRPDHSFRGYAGTIAAGIVRPGDRVVNAASATEAKIARIVTMDGDLQEAGPGEPVTLLLDHEIDVSRGDVIAAEAAAPKAAEGLEAWIVWMDETPLFRGRAYLLMLGTRTVVATVTDIATRLDMETLDETPVRELALNEIGRISISLTHPVVCEPYEVNRDLGGFILIDRLTRGTVGAGMVTSSKTRNADIHWHRLDVDKAARSTMKHQKPAVLWFTGLSGAGKSTIANQVEKRLHRLGHHTMILDGDNVRHGLNRDLGFSEADRVENIRRIAEVSRLFVEAGLIVIVSFISPYRAERMMARDRVAEGEFLEIFVDTPIDECRRRDPKGLYVKADSGQIRNFTGVDAPYEEPLDPEMRLRTLEGTPDDLAEVVVANLRERGLIG